MAFDLWGPSFPQEESSYCIQPEWQYDFYFGYGIDTIEENCLNEKSCVQVLRILIAKADTEIEELEKDLVFLQSELVWDEHEEWRDVCCNALRSKINCLDISIKKLMTKDENDIEVFLLVHTEPSEKLHEIVKALLKSFCHEKNAQNEQSQDVVLLSRSGSPDNSAALHKDQNSSSSDPCSVAKEENNAPSGTPKEKITSSNPSTELEVKKTNSSETQLANAEVNDLMPHSLLLAAGQLDEKSIVTMLDLEIIKSLKENVSTIKDKNTIQHFSSKSARKRTNSLNRTKVKDAAAQCVNNSDLDALKHSAGHLNKKKKLNSSSLKIVSDEITMHTSTTDMLILDSPNSMGITAGLSKTVKDVLTANIIAEDSCLSTPKPTADHSGEMKLCTHDPKVHGCEMQGCNTTTIRKSNMPNSCLNSEHEGNIQKADMVESTKCDMEQKLCDFVVKSPHKQGVKEFKVASTNKNQHSISLFKGDENREDPLPVVMRKEAALTDNELSALTSLIELQDGSGEDKAACRMGGKPQTEEVQMPEIVASDGKLVPNLCMRLQGGVVKNVAMNVESTPTEVEESGLKSKQNVSNSPPFPKGKKVNNPTLSYSLTGRIIKKTIQHSQHKAEVPSLMPGTSQNTMSLPHKRCKKLSSVPIVVDLTGSCNQMNISKLHGDLNRSDAAKTDFAKLEASIDNSSIQGMTSLPSEASSLMKMKLSDLKAIAKSQKLKKYSTMKKEDLVKQLENRLSC